MLKQSRKLVSQQDQALIARPQVPRSRFTNTFGVKTTFNQGQLIPFTVQEVLPGDHFKLEVTAFLRLSTLLFPMMDSLRVDTFFFFVPNRLVWQNWEKFMGEQNSPGDSIAYTVPRIESAAGGFPVRSLFDYMGIPVVGQITAGQTVSVNALPLRAYNLIYNDWFRDQNLINSASVYTGDTGDLLASYSVRNRAKSHDYFTKCLPWPQKFTAPSVPLSGNARVTGIGIQTPSSTAGPYTVTQTQSGVGGATFGYAADAADYLISTDSSSLPQIYADLSSAAGFSINVFRQGMLIQQMLERDARGGTRYVEMIKAAYGVTVPDYRLQRPEYIGGGSTPLDVQPVAQTTIGGGGLGALAAAATAVGQHRASYAATEHGHIIGIINVKSELSYQQGLHRMWTRSTRYDFYDPALAGLGEQAVLRQEIYCTGVDADDTTVFGYNERWQEYREEVSRVTGLFRATSASSIPQWHLAQTFSAPPTLNQTFIEDTAPMSRALAAGVAADGLQFLADILIRRDVVRPLPAYGTPVTLGRF